MSATTLSLIQVWRLFVKYEHEQDEQKRMRYANQISKGWYIIRNEKLCDWSTELPLSDYSIMPVEGFWHVYLRDKVCRLPPAKGVRLGLPAHFDEQDKAREYAKAHKQAGLSHNEAVDGWQF